MINARLALFSLVFSLAAAPAFAGEAAPAVVGEQPAAPLAQVVASPSAAVSGTATTVKTELKKEEIKHEGKLAGEGKLAEGKLMKATAPIGHDVKKIEEKKEEVKETVTSPSLVPSPAVSTTTTIK